MTFRAATRSNPLRGSQAAVTASQPVPLAVVAAAANSKSTLNSETRVDDGHWPATADPADPVAASNSDPVFSFLPAPVHSASRSEKEATPLFSSSNTPEASGTARKAPSGSLFGEPSRIIDRASISSDDPELDAICSALEAEWLRDGIVMKATAFFLEASISIDSIEGASA